ncbi:hypothetical protein MVLG_02657 [Microbotryum lychnidis-dioicae p1A1 Lamole]|uniref:Uncharacterized protein n=1 Tax=Microbotryum lychnidis-dioicae (strain p1A1 Lamole / MvSl-1064) TaxID=683840 RepID=U5H5U5_USTV1|nr:hypothetical protein MVLG_02657 [Microbotryum lychnidis-dioicae p1A1 Lamole]|eukprot:KDE07084.1 hypothetical protein MVLG_02657 [Microbotryum lychnidis-dioicae p1A1 Lamole]
MTSISASTSASTSTFSAQMPDASTSVAVTTSDSTALYQSNTFALIDSSSQTELFTIIATGLAMEEWKREEEEKGSKGGAFITQEHDRDGDEILEEVKKIDFFKNNPNICMVHLWAFCLYSVNPVNEFQVSVS